MNCVILARNKEYLQVFGFTQMQFLIHNLRFTLATRIARKKSKTKVTFRYIFGIGPCFVIGCLNLLTWHLLFQGLALTANSDLVKELA